MASFEKLENDFKLAITEKGFNDAAELNHIQKNYSIIIPR